MYQILRQIPEALPRLSLEQITDIARPLAAKAGMRLSAWKPIRLLRNGTEVVMRIPPQRGLKYLSAQADPGRRRRRRHFKRWKSTWPRGGRTENEPGMYTRQQRNTMGKAERKKKKGEKADRIEQSSGKVFADLGLNNPAELLAKAKLVQRIADIVTSAEAARRAVVKLRTKNKVCHREAAPKTPSRSQAGGSMWPR